MNQAAVQETTVEKIIQPTAPAPKGAKLDAVVVTGENFDAYVDKALGKPAAEEPAPVADSPEAMAAAELKKIEDDKAAKAKKTAEENEEIDHPDKSKKERLNGRFSELTKARKDAEAKAEANAKAASEAQARADAAENERNLLRAKYEPPKSDELGPKPELAQFTDANEWGKALEDWTATKTLKDEATKAATVRAEAERTATAKAWTERVEAHKKANPDFEAKIAAAPVNVSDQARDAILRSDVGPQILEHFADHPEEAVALGKLTVPEMLYSLGKLAGTLGGSVKKEAAKGNGATQQTVEISKAPAPISPLGSGGGGVVKLNGSSEVPKNWTFEDYKRARQAGQIQ